MDEDDPRTTQNAPQPIGVPPDAWTRYRARLLDPIQAPRIDGDPQPGPTLYVTDTLLVRDEHEVQASLAEAAAQFGLRLEPDPEDEALAEATAALSGQARSLLEEAEVRRYRLLPAAETERAPQQPPDAWAVLQELRARDGLTPSTVGLEHLITATSIGGTPYTIPHGAGGNPYTIPHGAGGNPYTIPHGGHGVTSYAAPGLGGRQPVAWVGPGPVPCREELDRRPVVAILDTAVTAHPWLEDDHVEQAPEVLGVPLGIGPSTPDTETTGTRDPLAGGLEPASGHGTFIAGLVRQRCPEAKILAVPIYHGDGVVAEGDLIRALRRLLARHLLALDGHSDYEPVDVLNLSLGYYHEQPEDADFDALLLAPLGALARAGVQVVVSAGNDATTRPMYPAAFAGHPDGPERMAHGQVPILAVGALNPDGTVAMFSNYGPWVRYLRPGAGVLSSFPASINTSLNPIASWPHDGGARASIDLDNFGSGFALWSGTSFSAPVLAGDIASALLERFDGGDTDTDPKAALARFTSVLTDLDDGVPQ